MRPFLFLVSILSVSSISLAQTSLPEQADEAPDSAAAQALHAGHLGLEAFRAERFEEALAAFTKAESLAHSPVFILYQGRASAGLGLLLDARNYFRAVAAEPLTDRSPSTWKTSVEQARELLVAIDSRIPRVLLRVQGAADFPVVLTVEGQEQTLESASSYYEALPGEYSITARDAEGQEVRQRWRAREGERYVEIAFVFRPVIPMATPPEVTWGDAAEASRWNAHEKAAFAAWGVGGLGVVLGAVFGGVALSQTQAVKERCQGTSCSPEDEQVIDQTYRWAQLSDVGFFVGGVGAVTGGVLFFTSPSDVKDMSEVEGATKRAITFQWGVSSGSLQLLGRF